MNPAQSQLVESCVDEYLAAKNKLLGSLDISEFDVDYELFLTLYFALHIDNPNAREDSFFMREVVTCLDWSDAYLNLLLGKINKTKSFTYLNLRIFRTTPAFAAVAYKLACGIALRDGELSDPEINFLTNLRTIYFGADDSSATQKLDREIAASLDGDAGQLIFSAYHPPRREEADSSPDASAATDSRQQAQENSSSAKEDSDSPVAAKTPDSAPAESVEDCLAELESLVGLTQVKREVRKLISFLAIQKQRAEINLPTSKISLHMVFTGNPGTGKTTVARIIARLYRALDFLTHGQLIETDRTGLVAQYVGHTEKKTSQLIDRALGGILFIDEAYSLFRASENDFGHQAIDTLVKRMEDERKNLVVIVAGYQAEMGDFIGANPGLKSRFTTFIDFPNFTEAELQCIFATLCEKYGYKIDQKVKTSLEKIFAETLAATEAHFGNARYVRNLFENALRNQALRLSASQEPLTREDLETLLVADL